MRGQRITGIEASQLAKRWYENTIKSQIDEQADRGKALIIDVETGEFLIDEDSLKATKQLLQKHSDAVLFGMRIGFPTFAKAGGGWRQRTT